MPAPDRGAPRWLAGDDLERGVLDGTRVLRDIGGRCYGPQGGLVALAREGDPDCVLSKTSGDVFGHVRLENALLRGLVDATAISQHNAFRDGGHLSLSLACALVQEVSAAFPPGPLRVRCLAALRHHADVVEALLVPPDLACRSDGPPRLRCGKCAHPAPAMGHDASPAFDAPPDAGVGRMCVELDWGNAHVLLGLARGVLSPKVLPVAGVEGVERMARLVVEGFVRTAATGHVASGLRTLAAPGGAVAASVLLPGVLAPSRLRIESGHERLLPMGPADAPYLVALFTCPLDVLAATEDQAPRHLGPAASIDMLSGDTQPEAAQLAALHAAVEALCAAGARVVASQRTIHPLVQESLRKRGVLPVERLSAMHVGAFRRATGAVPLPSIEHALGPALRDSLGAASHVYLRRVAGRDFLGIVPWGRVSEQPESDDDDSCPVLTLLCCAPTEAAGAALQASADAAHHVLRTAVEHPWVVPGAGAAELCLAAHLEGRARADGRGDGPESTAPFILARCLREVARRLRSASPLAAWEPADFQQAMTLEAGPAEARVEGGSGAVHLAWWGWVAGGPGEVLGVRRWQGDEVVRAQMNGEDTLGEEVVSCAVVDLAVAKASAMQRAVQAAEFVLRTSRMLTRAVLHQLLVSYFCVAA